MGKHCQPDKHPDGRTCTGRVRYLSRKLCQPEESVAGFVCNILGGLRGPSKRGAPAMEFAWAPEAPEAAPRLLLRLWRYSGMVRRSEESLGVSEPNHK